MSRFTDDLTYWVENPDEVASLMPADNHAWGQPAPSVVSSVAPLRSTAVAACPDTACAGQAAPIAKDAAA